MTCNDKKLFYLKNIQHTTNKPIEIYFFIDPLCPECWALEPMLKKLYVQYGQYFTIKHIVTGQLTSLNLAKKHYAASMAQVWERTATRSGMSCDGSLWLENPIESPYVASIAIKAAELQGRKAGIKYLRKLQEVLFLEKQNISELPVLMECAESVGLDMEEFKKDMSGDCASKALNCDFKITNEMDVSEIPTLVFFNENIEEEGIKVSGYHSYEVYVHILQDMLGEQPFPKMLPPLEDFLSQFSFVATKEISVVYNLPIVEVEHELKKLQLAQRVEKVPVKHGTFWRYIAN
ncbi:DsbA family protein [Sutcliffiella horikoshii]|uniref:ClpXP adapter protein SpxH n=1 Tax=Sutcliffiella horikoshii TaxID=79883 RepID=A0A5D4SU54_9BACI|nr:ClpXP adapter SpxH family protein [Sutcliffiella horikoshii]TYS65722.1 DsbA family protein [Sutcliffiella horikoshii]